MRNFRLWLGRHLTFDRAIIAGLAVLIVIGGLGLIQANKERRQLCAFVDDEHNKDRASIVLSQRELYTKYAKDFPTFIDTARKRKALHETSRRSYYAIRATRPDYCYHVRKNPVPPYPPLRAFMKRGPSPAVARALAPGAKVGENVSQESPTLKKGEARERDRDREEKERARGVSGSQAPPRQERLLPRQEPAPAESEPDGGGTTGPSGGTTDTTLPVLPPTEPPPDPPPPPPSCLTLPPDPEVCLPLP